MSPAALAAVAALGAFHGANPGMGWLFAVALGLQERSRRAVLAALAPIAAGHAVAVAVALLAVEAVRPLLPPAALALATGLLLIGVGAWKLVRRRHPRWVGMRVRRWELGLWSFVMASAHGAGLMLLPAVGRIVAVPAAHPATGVAAAVELHPRGLHPGEVVPVVLAVHTVAMLVVMGGLALLVYDRLGLAVLRTARLNLDLTWALALVAAGAFALFS